MRRTFKGDMNDAAKAAVVARYRNLPGLPDRVTLTRWLRTLHRNLEDGAAGVRLYCEGAGWPDAHWTVGCDYGHGADDWPGSTHTEEVSDQSEPFDAAAAARRLLSEARVAGFR